MKRHALWTVFFSCGILVGMAGCGHKETEVSDLDVDEGVSELDASGNSTDQVTLASAKDLKSENLELRLKVGDRFPLIKTIEQRLKQISGKGGAPIESSSMLTMTLAIQVEDITDGVKRLGVRYQQVRYEHDIAGEKVRYDSSIPEKTIPEAAQVYQGMVNNGFSFLLGADNRIVKVIDFDAFLKRCARFAPPEQQRELLNKLVATQEDEGVANFVDDSIGMLPYNIDSRDAGGSVKVGDTWRKNQQIVRPIPLTIDTMFKLESLNQRYANVELFGNIIPAKIERVGNTTQQRMGLTEKMSLRNGHCYGTCTIDRESGLPIQSRVVRQMFLTLELPTGAKFDQQKEIITTIRAFPQQQGDTRRAEIGEAPSGTQGAGSNPGSQVENDNGPTASTNESSNRLNSNVLPTGFQK